MARAIRMSGVVPIPALTSLRFFAALAVVVFHFRAGVVALFPAFGALEPLTRYGELGVDLFFVLSGFILTYNYREAFGKPDGIGYLRFLGLRLARIYPVHLATLAFLVVAVAVASARGGIINHPENFSAGDFALNVALLHAVVNGYRLTWNEPSWSLSAEWCAYIVFPALTLALSRIRGSLLLVGVAAGALAGQGLAMAFLGGDLSPLPRVGGEFLAGCALGHLHVRHPEGGRLWIGVAAGAVVALGVALWVWQPAHPVAILVGAAMFSVLVYALARASSLGWRAPGGPVLVFLGEASYALYMTHALVGLVGERWLPMSGHASASAGVRVLVLGTYVAVLFAAAVGTYLLIERPARRALRDRLVR